MRPAGLLVGCAARASAGAARSRRSTTAAIATSVTAKAALDERHGDGGAAVVDLESAAFVEAADEAGVPWLVLRAVADTADESLPAWLDRCRDANGAIRRARVVCGRCSATRGRCPDCSTCAAASPPAELR